jgi:hypothetical protein
MNDDGQVRELWTVRAARPDIHDTIPYLEPCRL